MKLVKVYECDDSYYWINPDNIASVNEEENGSHRVWFTNGLYIEICPGSLADLIAYCGFDIE